MKLFAGILAILAWLFGLLLLLAPEAFYAPTGMELTPLLATMAQAHGATLIGLGVVNWFARTADRQGLIAVFAGNLVAQVLSLVVMVLTMQLGVGVGISPGVAIYAVLALLCAAFLIRALRAPKV